MKVAGKEVDISHLLTAQKSLHESMALEFNDIVMDAAVHRYVVVFGVLWNVLKSLSDARPALLGPREVLEDAANSGLIESVDLWHEFLLNRNSAPVTYKYEGVKRLYDAIPKFVVELDKVIETIKTK